MSFPPAYKKTVIEIGFGCDRQRNKYTNNFAEMIETSARFQFQVEDNESTSFSSQDSSQDKSAILVKELRSNIRSQFAKNQAKYETVIKENPMFVLTLYQPKMDKALQNSSQLLAIKLDRLMEDEYTLDKELSKLHFKRQEDEEIKELELQNQMNYYCFLRKAWKKSKEPNSPEEHIDHINHSVGLIKGHVKHMARIDSQQNHALTDLIKGSKEFCDMELHLQELAKRSETEKQQLRQKIQALEQENKKLNQQNRQLSNKFAGNNEEKRKSEEKMLALKQKIQTLEILLLQKDRELKRLGTEDKKIIDKDCGANQITFEALDKSFSIVLKSQQITELKTLSTSRSLKQTLTYLQRKSSFQQIRQNPLFQEINNAERNKLLLQNSLKVFMPKRRLTVQKPERSNNRAQMQIGSSQQKKRRFQRTRGEVQC